MFKFITPPSVSRIHVGSIVYITSLQAFPCIFIMVVWYTTLVKASLPVPSNIPYLPFLITLGAGVTFSVTLLAHIVSCPRRICWVAYTLVNLFTAIALPCILSKYLDWEGIRILLRETKLFTVLTASLPVLTYNLSRMVINIEILSAKRVLCHPSPEDAAYAGRDASNLNPRQEIGKGAQSSATNGSPLNDSEPKGR